MVGLDFEAPLALARSMKEARPSTPVLLMVTNNSSLELLNSAEQSSPGERSSPGLSFVDKVFVWNGYSKLFVGMLKYVEDARNAEADTRLGQIRVILLIEDSIRYYSRYLPLLYEVVMRQTKDLIERERGGEAAKLLRSRARPKVLLASSWEEACSILDRYEDYLLAVIADLRFPRGGRPDPAAGADFVALARSRIEDLPAMIQSSEPGGRERAAAIGAAFADKNSESLERELGDFLRESLGFGPFRFRLEDGTEVASASSMDEFIDAIRRVPLESLLLHARRSHYSAWLLARGEAECAAQLRRAKIEDFASTGEVRGFLLRLLAEARKAASRGTIPYFDEGAFREEGSMTRLGDGSVGGKGRGILFISALLESLDFSRYLDGLSVKAPRSAFVGIDAFELFLESNGLWSFAFYDSAGEETRELRERFLAAPLDSGLVERLRAFAAASAGRPLAVRSSGLFEDMLMVPFSGVYDTYIIPNSHPDPERRLAQLEAAIKLTYASLFTPRARSYFELAGYALEEERMAVVVQELVGSRRGRWFYPHASGTAQSFNYYPLSYAKSEDGLCVAALGLGSYVVDGLPSYRFCPRYPKLEAGQSSRLGAGTQRLFRALDMGNDEPDLRLGEGADLVDLDLAEAERDPAFGLLASTWDPQDERLVPGIAARGMRIVDFSGLLRYDELPLAEAIGMILELGSRSMGCPVEIEFALELEPGGTGRAGPSGELYLLQLKPLIRNSAGAASLGAAEAVELGASDPGGIFIRSERSMGNGRDDSIRDIVWVESASFDRSATEAIAAEIEELDRELRGMGRRYVLVGPGRWGTRDRWLGVPVLFSQIGNARVIVETEMPGFAVDFSFGSHFFHNVTSASIGYLTIPAEGGSFVDWAWLSSLECVRRTAHCARAVLAEPLGIAMDGRKGRAVVRKRAGCVL